MDFIIESGLYRSRLEFIRGVHGYRDEGGELKNNWKNIFEEAPVKQFSKKKFEMKQCKLFTFGAKMALLSII